MAIESVGGRTGERFMRLAVINDDMPFLVDSVAATVAAHGLVIERLIHPVISVRRSEQGALLELSTDPVTATQRESVIYLETDRADAKLRRALQAEILATLADVRAAVTDWPAMRHAILHDTTALKQNGSDTEGAALLHWLWDNNLTQLDTSKNPLFPA